LIGQILEKLFICALFPLLSNPRYEFITIFFMEAF
jgi:hypothetical protein